MIKRYRNTTDIANPKDPTQWLAGGVFRNETFAGGQFFSPTSTPAFENKQIPLDKNSAILHGAFNFLNPAFSSINSFIQLGMFDLLVQDSKEVDYGVYSVSVEVVDTLTDEVIHTAKKEGSDYSGIESFKDEIVRSYTLEEKRKIADKPIEVTQNLLTSPLMAVLHIATSYDTTETIEINIGRVAYGTVLGTFRDVAINKSLSALGVAPASLMGFLLGGLIGLAFSEAMELATDTDNAFGFGGDYNVDFKAYEKQKGILGIGNAIDKVKFGLGLTDKLTTEYTNYENNMDFGYRNKYKDGSVFGNVRGHDFSGLSYEDAVDHYKISFDLATMNRLGWDNAMMDAYNEITNEEIEAELDSLDNGNAGDGKSGYDADKVSKDWARDASHGDTAQSFHEAHQSAREESGDDDGGGSYIATAMDKALGTNAVKFYEEFRDRYVLNQVGGAELMAKYYATSSKIVEEINKKPYSEKIYRFIYDKYLSKGIKLIKAKKHDEAFALYKVMVYDLYKRFLVKK